MSIPDCSFSIFRNQIYIYNLHGISLPRRGGLDPVCFMEPPLRFHTRKLRMDSYGWVLIQPSQPKQAIIRTGFDFNVFFSGVLQFQLVRSLTRRWT